MWKKVLIVIFTLFFAFIILLASIFRSASVKYELNSNSKPSFVASKTYVNYDLASPGKVLPDSKLWPLKALRDRIWLLMTTNPSRKAELLLLLADKRLGASKILFEKGEVNIGLSTLTKAEKYLEESKKKEEENRKKGIDTSEFLQRIALASLKHYEIMESLYEVAPDEARPLIVVSETYAKKTFEEARNAILDKGITPPENPFKW